MSTKSFKEYQGSSVLITGGLGFIGSNLARRLIEIGGIKVFIVDALLRQKLWETETSISISLWRLERFLRHTNCGQAHK